MHIEEAHCTKLFYYVYLCKFNVSLFKKVSLAPPLIAPLVNVFQSGSMYEKRWQTGLVNHEWFKTDFYKKKKCRSFIDLQ